MSGIRNLATVLISSALIFKPAIASNDIVELRVVAKANSTLGQLIKGQEKGVYKLTADHLAKALTDGYTPAKGGPTVIDLIDKYYIFGQMDKFEAEVKKLSDRGDPVAWSFRGWYLANSNMATKNDAYKEGLELMKRAAAAGVAAADNNEAMMLWMAEDMQGTLKYLSRGTADAHDLANYGLLLQTMGKVPRTYLPVLTQSAEAGDPGGATALAQYYADPNLGDDRYEALKWYLISYQGFSCMCQFDGLEAMINFFSTHHFTEKKVLKAKKDARTWLEIHPQMFMDGFDMVRLGAQVNGVMAPKVAAQSEPDSVLGCFWSYYVIGDKLGFLAAIQPFVEKEDANAYFMMAHFARGFAARPEPGQRRHYLEKAVAKHHPLAYFELAIDLWIDGSLESDYDRKQAKLRRAAELLMEGYDTWHNTKYVGAIGELTFLLGYFTEYGIGFDEPNQKLVCKYYSEAFDWTPLVAGHIGQSSKNPVLALACLSIARPSFTAGDWFGGVHHWQDAEKAATTEQKLEADKLAKILLKGSLGLTWNYYQRMSAGLDEAFSGL